ncbi:LutC/YkgG family protein [Myceligenerans xiligouense]|uniref:L-lactate dehydrogenase complex protein LldG n=1 Tax=Myceligenerans xiligouense TaxID=253184 RepID=A0A3N4YPT3_9MICO|nr:LUD domain-containing protein [Myceligenerans xiligouense]RPF23059.1 L-lactate dehydrogenase complex protein LldG [Myceligenerans xiligouense]
MTNARAEILDRIRTALSSTSGAAVDVPREYRERGEHVVGSAEVLDLLVDRLEDYKAHVHRASGDEVAVVVARLSAELAADGPAGDVPGSAASAGSEAAPCPGARRRGAALARPEALGTAGARVVVPAGLHPEWVASISESDDGVDVVADTPEAPLAPSDLDRTAGVVTAARVAVAETGTIVLDAGPDQGRRAISLVPDVHICVVRADQVVQTVPEAVRLLAHHPERPLTWISGPSATSDIELNRVEGVHGPRTLHVVLVD